MLLYSTIVLYVIFLYPALLSSFLLTAFTPWRGGEKTELVRNIWTTDFLLR